MEYGHVEGISKPISRVVQGTVMLHTSKAAENFILLDEILDQGGNTFDTAHGYGAGECELTFGRWANDRGVREKIVLIDKGAHPYKGRKRVTPQDITSDITESLQRLNFNYIDLYLLHRDDPEVPVGPIVEVLNEHLAAGRIHAFGGSNWTTERIQEANEYAYAHNLKPFVASSPHFSLAEQIEAPWTGCISISGEQAKAAREWYARTGMPLFTWSSLAGGFFSGRFRRDNLDTFVSDGDKTTLKAYCYEDNFKRLDRAERLAQQKGLSIAQIALSYVLSQPLNIFALVGSYSGAEFKENTKAVTIKLSPEEMAWLELRTDSLEGIAEQKA